MIIIQKIYLTKRYQTTVLSRAGNPGSKFSMEELEDSLAKIKEMLKERSDIINTLTPPVADDY